MKGAMLSVGTLAVVVMLLMCVGPAASQLGTSPVPRDDAPGKGSLMDVIYQTVMKLVPNPFTVCIGLAQGLDGAHAILFALCCAIIGRWAVSNCLSGIFFLFFFCCMLQITTSDISALCRPADVENAASKAHQNVRKYHISRIARARRLGNPFR